MTMLSNCMLRLYNSGADGSPAARTLRPNAAWSGKAAEACRASLRTAATLQRISFAMACSMDSLSPDTDRICSLCSGAGGSVAGAKVIMPLPSSDAHMHHMHGVQAATAPDIRAPAAALQRPYQLAVLLIGPLQAQHMRLRRLARPAREHPLPAAVLTAQDALLPCRDWLCRLAAWRLGRLPT